MNGGHVPDNSLRRDLLLVFFGAIAAGVVLAPVMLWWGSHQTIPTSESESTEPGPANGDSRLTTSVERAPGIWDPEVFAPPPNFEETINSVEDALIEIWCGEDSSGTGWLIDTTHEPNIRPKQEPADGELHEGLAVTAWHVVEDCTGSDEEMIIYRGQSTVPGFLLNWQKRNDVALLSVQLTRPGLTVTSETPLGMWTMTAGYPLSEKPTPVFGNLIGKEGPEVYTQMPIRPGHSGSPLVNSFGQAIGVVTAVPLDEESGGPYGWTISTSASALCQKLLSCPPRGIDEAPQ